MVNSENFGTNVERGKVLTVSEDGYVVESISRPGIRSGVLNTITECEISAGDTVLFCLFPDGTGVIFK